MADRRHILVPKDLHVRIEGDIVTVQVGKYKNPFKVHEKLLQARSPCLKQACEKAKIQVLQFASIGAATFDLYMQYIYTGTKPTKYSALRDHCDYNRLINLYALSAGWQDHIAMDAAISAMLVLFSTNSQISNADDVLEAYNKTEKGSSLRRLFVDMFVWQKCSEKLDTEPFDYLGLAPFLLDLSKASLAQLKSEAEGNARTWEGASCCDYHEHKRDAKCLNRKRKREDEDEGVKWNSELE